MSTLFRKAYSRNFIPINSNSAILSLHYACYCSLSVHDQQQQENLVASPARIRKVIAFQSDPLLAKEIFDLASYQPNFSHSYATFHTLILKLGRSRHFSLMETMLSSLKSQNYPIRSSLFAEIIQIYGEAGLPEEVLKCFYKILEFNTKPSPKHLNCILEILVARRSFLRRAFELFRIAHKYGVDPNTVSYNILMRAFCLSGHLSIAYSLFGKMLKRDVLPDIESYRILIQGFCRKSQVNRAVDLLEDMFNKGFFPDSLSYSTLLNSLCRKKQLREAYKLLCRMKLKGCNPDIVHYNIVIMGFCREGRALDACKVLNDMHSSGCSPNLVSYRTLVWGLCNQCLYDEARSFMMEMLTKGFSPNYSIIHLLVKGFCNTGKSEEACGVLEDILRHGETPHIDTWAEIVPKISHADDPDQLANLLHEVLKVEINPYTKIVDAGSELEKYLIKKIAGRARKKLL